jgi:hypothetical protein
MRPAGTNSQGWPVFMITRDEWVSCQNLSHRSTDF